MWLWRPRKPKGKELFFIELLGLSSAMHVVVALVFFLASAGHYQTFSLTVHHDDAGQKKIPVMFLGGMKGRSAKYGSRPVQQVRNKPGIAKNNNRKQVRRSTKKTEPAVAKKKEASATKTATTLAEKTNNKPTQPEAKRKINKKEQEEHKKEKSKEQPKEEIKKEEKKVEPEKPKEEPQPKQEEEIKEPVQVPVAPEAEAVDDAAEPFEYAMGLQEELGEEYEAMSYEQARIFMALREELHEQWRPPKGLSKDLMCTVVACVDHAGQVSNVCIKDGSGVLVYDISARQAMQKITLPPYAWGREYSIVFRQ